MEDTKPKRKWKKRLKRVLLSLLLFLFLLAGFAYLVFKSPTVQTYLVQKISDYLNKDNQSKISVRGVDIKLLDRALALEGVLVLDYRKDTLLYLDEIAFDVDSFSLEKHFLNARLFKIDKGLMNVKVYKGDTISNLSFFMRELIPQDTTPSKKWNITAGDLDLKNFEFRFNNDNTYKSEKGLDFAHLSFHSINAQLNTIHFDGDTLTTRLQNISAKEKSGFDLHGLSADVKNCSSFLELGKFNLFYNSTSLKGNVALKYNSYSDYSDFVNKVKMTVNVDESKILMNDIGYFAPSLLDWKQQIYLKGKASGKVNNLKLKNLVVETGNSTILNGNIEMEGLPDIDNTFIFADLKSLQTNYNDLSELTYPSDSGFQKLPLIPMLNKLGEIKFKGEFTGFIQEFVAHGKLNTDLGSVITDVQLKVDKKHSQELSGNINIPGFQLGRFLGNESLGNVVLKGTTKLVFAENRTNAGFDGKVSRFDLNGYSYSGITLNAVMNGKSFSGEVSVKDKYCDIDFSGDVNLAEDSIAYHFKSNVNSVYLTKLKLVDRDTNLLVSGKIEVNLKGNSLDELQGKAIVSDFRWKEGLFDESLGTFYFKTAQVSGNRKIDLSSSIADVSVNGRFSIENVDELMIMYFSEFSNHLIPQNYIVKKGQTINFSARIDDFKPIQRLFLPDYFLARNSEVVVNYSDNGGAILSLVSDSVAFPGISAKKIKLQGFPADDKSYKVSLTTAFLSPANKIPFKEFDLSASLQNNELTFIFNWNNDEGVLKNNAHIAGNIGIVAQDNFLLNLNDTYFYLDDKLWSVNKDNKISWSADKGSVNDLWLTMDDKTLKISGAIGNSDKDVLNLGFNGISIEFLNAIMPEIETRGYVNGNIQLSSALNEPKIISSLMVNDLFVNNQKFGETEIISNYLPEEEKVTLSFKVKRITDGEEGYLMYLAGDYFPFKEKEQLNCSVDFKNFRISLLQPYFKGILSDIGKAKVYGTLNIKGELTAPIVLGELQFKDFVPTVDYLNVSYDLNDKVTFKEDGIYFENFVMKGAAPYYNAGEEEGIGYINGVIMHNRFKDMFFNLEITTKKLIALNTNANNNLNYYGKAFVSGTVLVGGSTSNVVMYASLTTEKFDRGNIVDYTSIELPLDKESELPLYDFVEFIKEGDTSRVKKEIVGKAIDVPWLDMTFDFKITPDAKIKLIFDPRVGDEIMAQGNAEMQFQITSSGKFTMNGTYEVEKGEYFFTVKNIIAKKFIVSSGGTITWTGDPMDAAIDLKAVYKVRTKVSSLMDPMKFSQSQIDEMSSIVPVNVIMNLHGNLWKPIPTLDLEVNTSNPNAQEIVNDNIVGESETTKQAISLLMQGSFIVPDNSRTAGSSVLNAGLSNAKQFLTGQVNNYLSQITGEAFNVGFDYNAASADSLSNVALTVGKNFLNDKVAVSGTFDIGKDASDVEVQYKLTHNVTLKAFRKSQQNQKDQDGSIPTQGVGVFFRREFNVISELWKKQK